MFTVLSLLLLAGAHSATAQPLRPTRDELVLDEMTQRF